MEIQFLLFHGFGTIPKYKTARSCRKAGPRSFPVCAPHWICLQFCKEPPATLHDFIHLESGFKNRKFPQKLSLPLNSWSPNAFSHLFSFMSYNRHTKKYPLRNRRSGQNCSKNSAITQELWHKSRLRWCRKRSQAPQRQTFCPYPIIQSSALNFTAGVGLFQEMFPASAPYMR